MAPEEHELLAEIELLRGRLAQAEESRREMADALGKYAKAFRSSPVWMVLSTRDDGRYLEVNEAFLRGTGYTREEVLGRTSLEAGTWHDESDRLKALEILAREGRVFNLEVVRDTKDGRGLRMLFSAEPITMDGLPCLVSTSLDITDRHQAEAERLAAERRFRDFFDHAPIGIFRSTLEGRFLEVNQTLAQQLGYGSVEHMLERVSDISTQIWRHPSDRVRELDRLFRGVGWQEAEIDFLRLDGTPVMVHLVWRLVRSQGGDYLEGFIRDITEARQAEMELRQAEEMWRTMVQSVQAGILVHDAQGRLEMANASARNVLGLTGGEQDLELDHDRWRFLHEDGKIIPPEEYPVARVLATGQPVHDMLMGVSHDDEEPTWVLVNANPLRDQEGVLRRVLISTANISDRVQMEGRIREVQKLESLGVLAGGIAHDFNNILMGVLGNAGLALMDLEQGSPACQAVEQIQIAAKRLADLTNQLLAYSGKGRFLVAPLDVSELVRELGQLLATVVTKRAALRYQLAQDLPAVEADATQLRQVVMNLITNASDSLGEEDGIITVVTGLVTADRGYLASTYLDESLPEGDYIYVEVSDTGCGMDAETRARLFDPFFTTKFAGRGLGLAAVLGIVRGHRGAIKVYSEPGSGTSFKVLLPASSQPAQRERPVVVREEGLAPGTVVLVVDDEEMVRQVARACLERSGCRVLEAVDGLDAVETFAARHEEVGLVLLDMTMPRLGGVEAFQELRRLDADVRVILSSGYNEQEATSRFAGKGLAGFIQKPYTPSQLVAKIKEAMSSD